MVTSCTASLTFTNSAFCPHSVFMCFVWIWEQTAIISLYSINWLVCITETECVYCAVRTGSLYIIQVMCFVWIWEQTAIISLYSINWLVFITETECVYCAVRPDWMFIIQVNLNFYSVKNTVFWNVVIMKFTLVEIWKDAFALDLKVPEPSEIKWQLKCNVKRLRIKPTPSYYKLSQ